MSKPDEQEALSSQADGAQGLPPPHAAELRGSVASAALRELHGHRVAVRMPAPTGVQVLSGQAEYALDAELGQVLRIAIEGAGGLEIVLAEAVFHGRIARSEIEGCDFLIDVTAQSSESLPAAKMPQFEGP